MIKKLSSVKKTKITKATKPIEMKPKRLVKKTKPKIVKPLKSIINTSTKKSLKPIKAKKEVVLPKIILNIKAKVKKPKPTKLLAVRKDKITLPIKSFALPHTRIIRPLAKDIFKPDLSLITSYIPNRVDPYNPMHTTFILKPDNVYIPQLELLYKEHKLPLERGELDLYIYLRTLLRKHIIEIQKKGYEFEHFMLFQNNVTKALEIMIEDKNFPSFTAKEYLTLFKTNIVLNIKSLTPQTISRLQGFTFNKENLNALNYYTNRTQFKKEFVQYFHNCILYLYYLEIHE